MNCDEIRGYMEDFHYGELDEKVSSQVQSHLRTCAECARALEALNAEDSIYQAYAAEQDRALEVSPRLWHRVEERLGASTSAGRSVSAWLAESWSRLFPRSPVLRQAVFALSIVVLSVGATLLTVHYYRMQETSSAEGRPSQGPVRQNSLEAAILTIQRAERDYDDAITVLSKIVDKRKPSLDPLLLAEVERNLKAIDDNIAATRAAYHAHPSDPDLAHYMLTAYEKKVELLLELASS